MSVTGIPPIIAPIGEAVAPAYTCGVCRFVMNEVGECPGCKLAVQQGAAEVEVRAACGDILGSAILTENGRRWPSW